MTRTEQIIVAHAARARGARPILGLYFLTFREAGRPKPREVIPPRPGRKERSTIASGGQA